MMDEQERQNLKALIEEEESFLDFFVEYEKEFKEFESEKEWETGVDECLDILSQLYRKVRNQ